MRRNCDQDDQRSYLIDKDDDDHCHGGRRQNYNSVDEVKVDNTFNMNYDDILEELGELGPWQILNLALLWLPAMASGMFVLTYSFTGLTPAEFRCPIKECDSSNATFADLDPSWLFPYDNETDSYDFCKRFPVKADFDPSHAFNCEEGDFDFSQKVDVKSSDCPAFLFKDDFEFENTFVTDLNLYCDQNFKVALIGSIYMVGLFFGSFILGYSGDKFGRKLTLIAALVVGCTASLGGSFTDNYLVYAVTRFFTAIGSSGAQGCFLIPFSLSVELVGSKRKTLIGNMVQIPFAIGEAIVGLIAFGIREWKTLQIAASAPLFSLLLLYFILPESPRWLIATGRYEEAKKTIERAARMNKVKLSPHLLDYDQSSESEAAKTPDDQKIGPIDLFRNGFVRKVTLVMFVNWIVVTLGYYGISLSSTNLGGDIFVSFILTALIEIPSYIFCILVMDYWGRKPIFVSSLLLTGIAAIPAGFMEDGAAKTALALLGKFGSSASFSIVYLYTAELYPTVVRSTAVGMCSMMARIGGIAAPQVAIYLPQIGPSFLPLLIMGGSAILGGILSLLLPETLGSLLPDTMEDVEVFSENDKSFFQCWSKAKLKARIQQQTEAKQLKQQRITSQ